MIHFKMINNRVAVIDLGTNTFDMLIAESDESNFEAIYKQKISVRIGKDGISKGLITEDAQKRLLNALQIFANTLQQYKVEPSKIYCVATSAFRNAKNQKEILKAIKSSTNFDVQVISGDEEAEFIYFGVCKALNLGNTNVLIVDIGGGSVEFIIGNQKKILWKKSFEIGAQRLYDQYMRTDPISDLDIQRMEIYLEFMLVELSTAIFNYNPKILVGSAGSFDTLAEIHYRNEQGDEKAKEFIDENHELLVNEYLIDYEGFHDLYRKIVFQNKENRLKINGMIEMRVDMIVVAVCLIKFLIERYDLEEIRTSTYALKEGYLLSKL